LVIVKKSKPQRERNGASLKPKASTLSYTLDTAVVVIDGMTIGWLDFDRSEFPERLQTANERTLTASRFEVRRFTAS